MPIVEVEQLRCRYELPLDASSLLIVFGNSCLMEPEAYPRIVWGWGTRKATFRREKWLPKVTKKEFSESYCLVSML